MLITLKSSNPNLSYAIKKSPSAPPRISDVRKGNVVGWFGPDSDTEYNMAFIDSHDEVSFGGAEFDYLDHNKYANSYIANKCLDSLLSSIEEKHDGEYDNEIKITSINARTTAIRSVVKNFANIDFDIEQCPEWPKYQILTMKMRGTLASFIDYVNIICFYLSLDSKQVYFDQNLVNKYIGLISRIDAPYFIRYLFKCNMLMDAKSYERCKDELNKSNNHSYDITAGNNRSQRRSEIKRRLDWATQDHTSSTIIDVGCGEGWYMTNMAPKCGKYICVDTDEESLDTARRKSNYHSFSNVVFFNNMSELNKEDSEDSLVICSEVIEHIELNDLDSFWAGLNSLNSSKIIITTPNRDFNKFYGLVGDEVRHDDHKFEWTKREFHTRISKAVDRLMVGRSATFFNIGDVVDGIPTTLGCEIS